MVNYESQIMGDSIAVLGNSDSKKFDEIINRTSSFNFNVKCI